MGRGQHGLCPHPPALHGEAPGQGEPVGVAGMGGGGGKHPKRLTPPHSLSVL